MEYKRTKFQEKIIISKKPLNQDTSSKKFKFKRRKQKTKKRKKMSGGFHQSIPSSPFSIIPVSGLHPYPYPVQQQNPVMVMSSPQVQFPVHIQPTQSQFPPSQAIPLTSQFGQSMVLIPIDIGQQQQSFISSQFPQNVISGSVPTPPSSSESGKNSESTINEQPQTCFCPTETLNQSHGGYYLLQPISDAPNFQPDQNSTEEIGNLQESVSSTSTTSSSTNPTCQCQLCSGCLPSAPSLSSVSVDTSSNGLGSIQQPYSLPVPSWNFPLHQQPTPIYQYVICPIQPAPFQFPSIPMSNFDGNFENFYRNSSSHRQGAAWSKKNPQPPTPPKPMCGFCKSNREPKEVYRGHWLRNDAGDLICPSLRKYVCPICQSTGDDAHTIKYCPVAPSSIKPSESSESSTKEIKDEEN